MWQEFRTNPRTAGRCEQSPPSGIIEPNVPRVRLFLTCLCDAFFGEVGIATVKCLEHAGCEVEFVESQTCCGQPPFNAGDWADARRVATHCRTALLETKLPVVAPSSSCTAMVRHGFPMLFEGTEHENAFELAEFLVHEVGLQAWPAKKEYKRKIALHRACHGRALGLTNEQELLLQCIPGVELIPFNHPEQCCGFGGAFSVNHKNLSANIGLEKLHQILESGAEEIVGGDMGCLMHLDGLIQRNKMPLTVRHFAEILAEVIE